jgi:alpha-tubulin suppressor-like RCC1 family protein
MRFALKVLMFSSVLGSCSEQNSPLPLAAAAPQKVVDPVPEPPLESPLRIEPGAGMSGRHSLSAGEHHNCVIAEGAVYCWGYGLSGQLGQGDTLNSAKPLLVSALGRDNQAVFAGDLHSCAIKRSGAVYCWGYNQTGAVGNGRSGRDYSFSGQAKLHNVTTPSLVQGLEAVSIQQIAATKLTSCGLAETGDVYCWGSGAYYELGDATKDDSATRYAHHSGVARRVTVLDEAAQSIHAGDRAFCAVTVSNRIKCWGTLALPQETSYPVVDLSPSKAPTSLAMADQHSCFIAAGHELHCIGDNWYQQTGLSQVTNVWTRVSGESFTKIATARKTTCGITPSRSVRCWGVCLHGLCGPHFTAKLISPTQAQNVFAYTSQRSIEIEGLAGAVDLVVGARHACALLDNGQIKCWGNGFLGELGNEESQSSAEPVEVTF